MSFVAMTARLIAIDPGDVHVGAAEFKYDPRVFRGHCESVAEFTPDELLDGLAESLVAGDYDAVVVERFLLRPDLAAEQAGSEMLTSQMIGAIRWMVRKHNEHAQAHEIADRPNSGRELTCRQPGGVCSRPDSAAPKLVQLGLQTPDVQAVAAGHLRAARVKSVAKQTKAGAHCLSAELHGWHWLNINAARVARADQIEGTKPGRRSK